MTEGDLGRRFDQQQLSDMLLRMVIFLRHVRDDENVPTHVRADADQLLVEDFGVAE